MSEDWFTLVGAVKNFKRTATIHTVVVNAQSDNKSLLAMKTCAK